MSALKILSGSAVAAALLATSIAPAYAGPGWGHRRHRDRVDVDAGDVIAGIFVIGAIAAIASGGKQRRREREEQRRRERDEEWQRNRDSERTNDDRDQGRIASERDAVDACAQAAEDRAGRAASVRDITDVARSGDGWEVRGVIERRSDWRDRNADSTRFSCTVRYGRVESVEFGSRDAV